MSIFGELEVPSPQLAEFSVHIHDAYRPFDPLRMHLVYLRAVARTAFADGTTLGGICVGFFVNGEKVAETHTDQYGQASVKDYLNSIAFNEGTHQLVARIPGLSQQAVAEFELHWPTTAQVDAFEKLPLGPITPKNESNVSPHAVSDDSTSGYSVPPTYDWSTAPQSVANSIGQRFALVRPGIFEMGLYRRTVHITQSFYFAVFPTTQSEFQQVMGRNPSFFSKDNSATQNPAEGDCSQLPVEMVSWDEAIEFCRLLTALPAEGHSHWMYALPTEAQWEYACRAGTNNRFSLGDGLLGRSHGNFNDIWTYEDGDWPVTTSGALGRPTVVGTYPPNGWGLYDMYGNVWEWCRDSWRPDNGSPRSSKDPVHIDDAPGHVVRGGSWKFGNIVCGQGFCAGADRDGQVRLSAREPDVGFRVIRFPVTMSQHY